MKRAVPFFLIFALVPCSRAAEEDAGRANDLPYRRQEAPLPTDHDLKAALETALDKEDWANLPVLLKQYRSRYLADQIFADYAEARWHTSRGEHIQAQALLRRVLARRPDWDEARTAMMHSLSAARSRPKAGANSRRLGAGDVWQLPLDMNYERSDSAYYASRNRTGLRTGSRPQGSRSAPATANALRFNLNAQHDFSLRGNHKLHVGLTSGGTHYWDYYDISTRSVRFAAGYRNTSGSHSWALTPYTEQNWLGGERHTLNKGASAGYSNKLNDNWRVSLSASSINRTYNNPDYAKYYDGIVSSFSGTAEFRPDDAWTFNAGADYRSDQTDNAAYASGRTGIRTGVSRQFENGLKLGTSLQYGYRAFGKSQALYGIGRKDDEYSATASLSFKPHNWKGVTPKFDYRYSKVDSNVDTSSSETSQWFMSLEKRF